MNLTARQQGEINRQRLQNYFARYPNWVSVKRLSVVIGINSSSVNVHCNNLANIGYLERQKMLVRYPNKGLYKLTHFRLATVGQLLSKSTRDEKRDR